MSWRQGKIACSISGIQCSDSGGLALDHSRPDTMPGLAFEDEARHGCDEQFTQASEAEFFNQRKPCMSPQRSIRTIWWL